ncbi:MAG: YARHG domain-containing protein [Lachnospiraceae bacterium]|nr:YARHG domain-containing protein [Lachnospiraceae bacterium]
MIQAGEILYGKSGRTYRVKDKLGEGGEGIVYNIDDPSMVAKVYKKPSHAVEKKILSMLKDGIVLSSPGGIPLITWPQDAIYYGSGFVGYVMPRVTGGFPIWKMGREDGRQELFRNQYDWSKALVVAANLASLVAYLHDRKIVIGDMNSNNISVHPNGYVTIMDVDSFDIRDRDTGEHFKCTVGRPEYLAPELQVRRSLADEASEFTEQTDDFALAVHIFQLLFHAHPFNMKMIVSPAGSKGENQQADAIVEGNCPFVKAGKEGDIQPGIPWLSMLPDYLQQDFRETFDYHALNSIECKNKRTKARVWYQDLTRLYQEKGKSLIPCEANTQHYYINDGRGCELCRAQKRLEDHNKRMIRWDIEGGYVNEDPSDLTTSLTTIDSNKKWYSHYLVKNSPLSMEMPLAVRYTYADGKSSVTRPLPKYKTGDSICVEGRLEGPPGEQEGLCRIDLLDGNQNVVASSSVEIKAEQPHPKKPEEEAAAAKINVVKKPFYKRMGFAAAVLAFFIGASVMIAANMESSKPSAYAARDYAEISTAKSRRSQTEEAAETHAEEEKAENHTETRTEARTEVQTETSKEPQPESQSGSPKAYDFVVGKPDRNFLRIINMSEANIYRLYLSKSSSTTWGESCLGKKILGDHKYIETNLDWSESWDMAAEDMDGNRWEFMRLDGDMIKYGSEVVIYATNNGKMLAITSNTSDGGMTENYADAKTIVPDRTQQQTTQAAASSSSGFILPESDSRYYTEAELVSLSKSQLRLARNELYARRGRKFNSEDLNAYFNQFDWYSPTIEPEDFNDDSMFNKYEKANRDLIKSME